MAIAIAIAVLTVGDAHGDDMRDPRHSLLTCARQVQQAELTPPRTAEGPQNGGGLIAWIVPCRSTTYSSPARFSPNEAMFRSVSSRTVVWPPARPKISPVQKSP